MPVNCSQKIAGKYFVKLQIFTVFLFDIATFAFIIYKNSADAVIKPSEVPYEYQTFIRQSGR